MTNEQFAIVYETYKVMVFQIAYSYLQSVEDAEDAVLESFMRLLRINKNFVSSDDERRYLTRIVVNVSKDMLRKKRPVSISDPIVAISDEPLNENEYIWDEVNKLKTKYKDVIILRYVNEYSFSEIAKVLKISASAARKRHERALKMLKEELEHE
ncbi:MAG TPA: sigma-70 family RNA polymerase sigma factor [Bacilli bacterium]|jgi:RNA polymerase sigma factor (sigma-70 family)|nr:sigma-70 family RNA polymerase sigma factor [Bacilli bacterium]HPK28904.1 sigma-70 family RNA polymerase sigma factor [Bacilli bacterium]HZJ89606.1 sigma-70 family RNA polymerase sigma factor [Bacilli bacterium]